MRPYAHVSLACCSSHRYAEHTRQHAGKRRRLGALAAVPRPSRAHTWPRDLELTAEETAADPEEKEQAQRARRVEVPHAAPAWAEVTPPPCAANEPAELDLRQHFFLRRAGEVGERLREEHGLGGSWDSGGGGNRGGEKMKKGKR